MATSVITPAPFDQVPVPHSARNREALICEPPVTTKVPPPDMDGVSGPAIHPNVTQYRQQMLAGRQVRGLVLNALLARAYRGCILTGGSPFEKRP